MDIGCENGRLNNQVEVYAIGGKSFRLFIFWILNSKNRVFHEIAKHL
jgi:hypothetical protein